MMINPSDPIEEHFRLIGKQKQALRRLGLLTVRDLLFHFPLRYEALVAAVPVSGAREGESIAITGRIDKLTKERTWKTKIPIAKCILEDVSGTIRVVWFHQPYIAARLYDGALVALKGKVARDSKGLYLANPDVEMNATISVEPLMERPAGAASRRDSVYSESAGITSRWMRHAIKKLIAEKAHLAIHDPIPKNILERYRLPSLSSAIVWIHLSAREKDAEAARKRFAFEEVFFIQLERQRARALYQNNPSFTITPPEKAVESFTARFPFALTNAQRKAIEAIVNDLRSGKPMSRLLEGDVGSGKTAVAATVAHAVTATRPDGRSFGNLQAAIMAPTDILAKQHFATFTSLFAHTGLSIGLITSHTCLKFPSKVNPREATKLSRAQLLKWVASGEIPILVGTHALIQKSVRFKHLAFCVIDEQHRFGVEQRATLALKHLLPPEENRDESKTSGIAPHLLSMTATPIPRTLALTLYGDLDLTLLDEMPAGRKPIITKVVPKTEREAVYGEIRKELRAGRQLYVICPRIDEPDLTKAMALIAKSVKEEAARLKKHVFLEYSIEILHSKLKMSERDLIMDRFSKREIDILVATSVVEVGVNVPNATTIVIEGAERFGLAQLHQLRGRVLRSTHQAYCYLFTESHSMKTLARLKAITKAKNGFELAEMDLKLRGAGELSGGRQWGISDIGMEAIRNLKMVEAARTEAQMLLKDDADLKSHPLIAECLKRHAQSVHFE